MSRIKTSIAIGLCLIAMPACGSDDDDGGTTATEDTASTGATDGPEPTEPDETTGTTGPDATEPDDSGEPRTLHARFGVDPSGFYPHANATDIAILGITQQALVQPSPDGSIVNVLADTYEISEDGLRIDFTLKQGVQFHGGYGEVTAEDVKFSLERAAGLIPDLEPTGGEVFYTALERIDVTDRYSGTLVLSEPSVPLVEQALPLTGILSKAAFDAVGVEGLDQHPIGTGAYEFEEWVPGEYVRLVKFDEYADTAPWIPDERFDELMFHIIPEDSAAELAYEAGDIDMLAPMRAAALSRFEALGDTTISRGESMIYRWIGMNVLDPALSNPDLRNAIIAAIDVPSIIEVTSEGQDTRSNALVAPSAPIGYWADAPVHEQDLDEARRLVELVPEADRTLKFTIADDEMSRTVAQIAQANLQEAGLTVEIETLDAASFFVTGETNRERQLFYTEFGINYREPTQELVWFTCAEIDSWNYMYWCNEEYDALLAQAQVELDRDARNQMYIEMQELWEEAAHTVWISYPTVLVASRTDVVDVVVDPSGTVFYDAVAPS
jgi:peptide/nickel transport system substrate-binding protein